MSGLSHFKFPACDVRHALFAKIHPKYLEVNLIYSLDNRAQILHSLYALQQGNMRVFTYKHIDVRKILLFSLHI